MSINRRRWESSEIDAQAERPKLPFRSGRLFANEIATGEPPYPSIVNLIFRATLHLFSSRLADLLIL